MMAIDKSSKMCIIAMDWTGLDWTGLDWTGLDKYALLPASNNQRKNHAHRQDGGSMPRRVGALFCINGGGIY